MPEIEESEIKKWRMLIDVTLYPWQKKAVDLWLQKKRGTMKVVTGAGKTILALAIIEELQRQDSELRVVIIVPTIVLLNQWRDELYKHSNLPAGEIGFLGGGYHDSFADKRILVCVLNSAAAKLPGLVDDTIAKHLLLVVDECHRAGAKQMSNLFAVERAYNLGLSATPERDEAGEEASVEEEFDLSFLGKELGPIIYEMTLAEAFDMAILPKFQVVHYGLYLTEEERNNYDSLSRSIQELTNNLRERGNVPSGKALFSWCQKMSKTNDTIGKMASHYLSQTAKRKHLLYNAQNRSKAVLKVLAQEKKQNPDVKAILFHESIYGVETLHNVLVGAGYPAVIEHSKLPDKVRAINIESFRSGESRVIVSAKSLIEGFNVPTTDMGIIVASSTSIRQRIQTLGRVLRKSKVGGRDKQATVYVLYMHETTDEMVYAKADWDKLIGSDRNCYYLWDLDKDPELQDGPPRQPAPKEKDIDPDALTEGVEYPGDYDGVEYSCDTDGNVFDEDGNLISNPGDIPSRVYRVKGSYGRFKVTPHKRFVLVLSRSEEGWAPLYVSRLAEPFVLAGDSTVGGSFDSSIARLGDEYPASNITGKEQSIFFKQSRGRLVIARKMGRGEVFARQGEMANDERKGEEAKKLLDARKTLQEQGVEVSKALVTEDNCVVFAEKGKYRFLYRLTTGLEFPM